MPLVYASAGAAPPAGEARERARKVKPQYVGGELVTLIGMRPAPEAELVSGMLLEEGIPSDVRATRGFEVPGIGPGGGLYFDVRVPQAALDAARELIGAPPADAAPTDQDSPANERALRLIAGMLVAVLIGFLIVWLLYQVAT